MTQQEANSATRRWHLKYSNYCDRGWFSEGMKKVYALLQELGPTPAPAAVNAAIGNSTWTDLRCENCKEYVETAVSFESDNFDEYGPTLLCRTCIGSMHRLIS